MSAARTAPTPMPDAGHAQISEQLRKRLLTLDYPDFARCVCRLLEALGYEDARPAGRGEWKGYNRPGGGGWDLEATLPGGLAPRRVVAQIKQYATLTVHQRSVDELRGACLRAGASEGLLVTTSGFSEVVRKGALLPAPAGTVIVPIRLIGGEELVALMLEHRLGVRERGWYAKRGRENERDLDIDEPFFTRLTGSGSERRHSRPTLPGLRVTVQIHSCPCPKEQRRHPKAGGAAEGGRGWKGEV